MGSCGKVNQIVSFYSRHVDILCGGLSKDIHRCVAMVLLYPSHRIGVHNSHLGFGRCSKQVVYQSEVKHRFSSPNGW